MNFDDIVAIGAIRTAHGMHMPEQIYPISEHEHNKKLQSTKSDGHWLAGDIEKDDVDERDGSEIENSSDGDSDEESDQEEVDIQTLEVLRAALSPFPSPMTSSTSPPTSMESLSLSSHSTVATTSTYRVIGRGTAGTIYSSLSYPSSALEIGLKRSKRATQLWLLYFDKAAKSQLPRDGKEGFGETDMCRKMVTAVTANDPYLPTPIVRGHADVQCDEEGGCVEKQIQVAFEETYIAALRVPIIRNKEITKTMDLSTKDKISEAWPKEFLRMWKARASEIREGKDGGFVVSG